MTREFLKQLIAEAQASNVLDAAELEAVASGEGLPVDDVPTLCQYLMTRGALSAWQCQWLVSTGKPTLQWGRYRVVDADDTPGIGQGYRVMAVDSEQQSTLRLIREVDLAPADRVAAFAARLQRARHLQHAALLQPLDVLIEDGNLGIVLPDPPAGSTAQAMLAQHGVLPLSAVVTIHVNLAWALKLAHGEGLCHGGLSTSRLWLQPPESPGESPRGLLLGLGQVPYREADPSDPYLAPERRYSSTFTPAGDVYSLAMLFIEMTPGRVPSGYDELPELRHQSPALHELIQAMRQQQADARPTMAEVAQLMRDYSLSAASPAESGELLPTSTDPANANWNDYLQVPGAAAQQLETSAEPDWGYEEQDGLSTNNPARRRTAPVYNRRKLWLQVGLFLLLNALALVILLVTYFQPFSGTPSTPTSPR